LGTGSLQDTKQLSQNRTAPQHIFIKTTSTENRERILKAVREKKANNIKVNPSK
jgi:ribosomal protein L39E